MKKIVLMVNDDGSMELDGQPVESAEDALEQVKMSIMPEEAGSGEVVSESPEGEMPEGVTEEPTPEEIPEETEDEPMESESIGKTLESKMPMMDKKKMGMRPKKKASFEDYGI